MEQLDRRRLIITSSIGLAGVATSLVGVYLWSIEFGLILTGLVLTGAAGFGISLEIDGE